MMIDRLGPYPTMQDSGVPWLGEVIRSTGWCGASRRSFEKRAKEAMMERGFYSL